MSRLFMDTFSEFVVVENFALAARITELQQYLLWSHSAEFVNMSAKFRQFQNNFLLTQKPSWGLRELNVKKTKVDA